MFTVISQQSTNKSIDSLWVKDELICTLKVHMQERDVPVGPGTQYVLAAVSSEGRTKDWSTKVNIKL